jgi:hypothetical protein
MAPASHCAVVSKRSSPVKPYPGVLGAEWSSDLDSTGKFP